MTALLIKSGCFQLWSMDHTLVKIILVHSVRCGSCNYGE
jgi:hypothetical protein